MPEVHPSHDTRISDASSFDEICNNCGETDGIGTFGKLVDPCVAAPAVTAKLEEAKTAISKRTDPVRIYGEPKPSYFVFRAGANAPSHRHHSRFKAAQEAERLSRKNPGVLFHVVKLKDSFMTPGDPRIGLQCMIHDTIDSEERGLTGTIVAIEADAHGEHFTVSFPEGTVCNFTSFSSECVEIINLDIDGDPLRQFDRVEIVDHTITGLKGRILWVGDEIALVQIDKQQPAPWHPSKLRKLGKPERADPTAWLVGKAA